MSRCSRIRRGDDRGVTLAEQLVVMVLLSGLALLVATITVDLARGSEQHRLRVSGLRDQQTALEIVTKDLRAADPLVSATTVVCEPGRQPTVVPAPASCANALVLELTRQGTRWRATYALVGGVLQQDRERWTGSAWGPPTRAVLARGLRNGTSPDSPLFALSDAAGQPATAVAEVSRVGVLLAAADPRTAGTLPVSAEVAVRNRVARSAG